MNADGFEFLANGKEGSFTDSEGNSGEIYSDGSGYYKGADGSYGQRYSDRSGFYHGADGSEGTFYTNGNAFYDDADGGSIDIIYDDTKLGKAIKLLEAIAPSSSQVEVYHPTTTSITFDWEKEREKEKKLEEKKRRQEEKEQKIEEKRKEKIRKERIKSERKAQNEIRNKQIKAFFFDKKRIRLEYSLHTLIGRDINEVLLTLEDSGFTNVKYKKVYDIYVGSNNKVDEVGDLIIDGERVDSPLYVAAYDADIIVEYHKKMRFGIPYSPRQMIRKDYKKIVQDFFDVGFTEIYSLPANDLKLGWFAKAETIIYVVIGNEVDYKKNQKIDYDTKIQVVYHSFKR